MAKQAPGPLLRDVIHIKESISTSDFVLQLSQATTSEGASEALREYVVTERLLANYDEALGLIKSALDGRTSKAAYLHGSFGSGKSHFMAVLHALLSGRDAVREHGGFEELLGRHTWLGQDGKKFLLVPTHMLGAKALEQRVLGDYVRYVQKLHPEAPTPQVYRTDGLVADIRAMRRSLGDDAVIAGLTTGGSGVEEDEWGDSFAWTSALLDTALAAEEEHESGGLNLVSPSTPAELRAKLVQDATTTLLPGYARTAAEDEHGFISLDAGLSVISAHAQSLGYDGLILFLDELILWLATVIHDQKLVGREAGKIANLVEAADERRAIPVVSFIARQRDLRELVGEEVSGVAESAIQDSLGHGSGRFDMIKLEDRNLPEVAHKRLLQPLGDEQRALMEAEFEKARTLRREVWDTLLGSSDGPDGVGADEQSFRLTYPFSPAFMETLIHVSGALQRNRTGMKLMGQLLVQGRNHLRLGQLIPVGDLYPLIAAGGDKPFTDDLKVIFEAADRFYRTKMRPYLLEGNQLTDDQVEQYQRAPQSIESPELLSRLRNFVGDNRIVGTLLLAALVPSVPALSHLTVRRLNALNHGAITAPIVGREQAMLDAKIKEWAIRFPEIKRTGSDEPGVRLELSDVDVESVIANASSYDSAQSRESFTVRLLCDELGVTEDKLAREGHFVWRGTDRSVEVAFGHVADAESLADHEFAPKTDDETWRIIVGLPYSEHHNGPRDDAHRVHRMKEEQPGAGPRTVVWLPTYLSATRFKDFTQLVVIENALADDARFETHYAQHLNPEKRASAKNLLESQRETLRDVVRDAFRQAYGLAMKKQEDVELGFDDHLSPLRDIDELAPPLGRPLHEGLRHISRNLLATQYPAHPELAHELSGRPFRRAEAQRVFEHVRAAAETRDHRVEVPQRDRGLMAHLAEPLQLGQQKEAYFQLSPFWAEHFRQFARTEGRSGDLSFITLSDWTDRPQPRGLPLHLVQLVIATFGEVDDRVWVREGTTLDPQPHPVDLRDRDVLRTQPLPSEEDWRLARERVEVVFGTKPPALRRGRMVQACARQIVEAATGQRAAVADLVQQLTAHAHFLGLDETDEAGRLALAQRASQLLDALSSPTRSGTAGAKQTIETLATFDLGATTTQALGATVSRARPVADALDNAHWDTLALAPTAGAEGARVLDALRETAREAPGGKADLASALKETREHIVALLHRDRADRNQGTGGKTAAKTPPAGEPRDNVSARLPEESASGATTVSPQGSYQALATAAPDQLREVLAELGEQEAETLVEVGWRVVQR